MHTEFRLDQRTIETVFRNLFAAHITACGLQELHATSLRAQYAEIDYATRAHIWASIKQPARTEQEKASRNKIRDLISDAVLEVSHRNLNNNSVRFQARVRWPKLILLVLGSATHR
jgi:hypothetical protein